MKLLAHWVTVLLFVTSLVGCTNSDSNGSYQAPPATRSHRDAAEKTIGEMKVGETGWCVPWAMNADEDRTLWLDPNHTVSQRPGGTVCMLVRKTANGIVVDITAANDQRWHLDGHKSDALPVASIDGYTKTGPQAKLPEELRQQLLTDLKEGQSAWTVPWAMTAGADGKLWIDTKFSIHERTRGTAAMKVTRTGDGYTCDISRCKDRFWSKSDTIYVGGDNKSPVVQLVDYPNGGAQATLPEALRQQTILDLTVGESAWTVPWGMFADKEGKLWLNGKYSIDRTPGGTVAMKVTRTASGYECDISKCKHDKRWGKGGAVYVGGSTNLPVSKLTGYANNGTQAELPESLREQTLLDLKVGESCWTVPWAMYCDEDGQLKLNGDYSTHSSPGGTVDMKVTRTTTGYQCDISNSRLTKGWDKPGKAGFAGDFTPLPVDAVITK